MCERKYFAKVSVTIDLCQKTNCYIPNGYIVPMQFRVHFFPRISAFSRHTEMHLNGMLLIRTDFFKIIVPCSSLQSLGKIDIFQLFATRE